MKSKLSKTLFDLKFASISMLIVAIAINIYILFPSIPSVFSGLYECTGTEFYLNYMLRWLGLAILNLVIAIATLILFFRLRKQLHEKGRDNSDLNS